MGWRGDSSVGLSWSSGYSYPPVLDVGISRNRCIKEKYLNRQMGSQKNRKENE
ncbi:hypothetical protein D918_01783 [Trichuris suis]|nr:hypothetical protein D918_01783 [Trichuris suis]